MLNHYVEHLKLILNCVSVIFQQKIKRKKLSFQAAETELCIFKNYLFGKLHVENTLSPQQGGWHEWKFYVKLQHKLAVADRIKRVGCDLEDWSRTWKALLLLS